MTDMIQIKLAVEGMKAQIIKAFDAEQISKGIREATEKAVDEFDMGKYIEDTVRFVFDRAQELAVEELAQKYGSRWVNDLSSLIDKKIDEVLTP